MSSNKSVAIGQKRQLPRTGAWVRAFWPLALIIGGGATIYRTEVIDTILSTQHPALVYTIFGVLIVSALLTALALWHFEREERLAVQLQAMTDDQRLEHLERMSWKSHMLNVYDTALNPDLSQGPQLRQQKIDNDLFGCEELLLARLDLPNYLGNSLIGIGLVGTFIGLLSSLSDLSSLLSGLGNTQGGSSDPITMFSGMMQKLQKPMKGMGTSFVASLYGLLGSLVMGLVVQSVRKTGNMAIVCVRDLLRSMGPQLAVEPGPGAPVNAENIQLALEQMLKTIRHERTILSDGLGRFADAIGQQSRILDVLNQRVDLHTSQIRELGELLAELRDMGRRSTVRASWTPPPGGAWLRIGSVVALGIITGSAVTSVMAVRSSEQLGNRIAAVLFVAAGQSSPFPAGAEPGGTTLAPARQGVPDSMCVILEGDTLDKIARRHGVAVTLLLKANPSLRNPGELQTGKRLRIPRQESGKQKQENVSPNAPPNR